MKRVLVAGVVLLAVLGSSCAGYFLGFQKDFDRALLLQNGTFVGAFDALQKYSLGDIENGARRTAYREPMLHDYLHCA